MWGNKGKKRWYTIAREEGRLCRICHEPVSKHNWSDKIMDHLCVPCYFREMELPHDDRFRLGRDYVD